MRCCAVIIGLIDQFCREHLNDEYAVLCRKLAEKLARKRPSPLLHGKPEHLGQRHRADHRLGQLPGRPEPDAAHEADGHRRGVRRRRKQRGGEVEGHP